MEWVIGRGGFIIFGKAKKLDGIIFDLNMVSGGAINGNYSPFGIVATILKDHCYLVYGNYILK